MVVTCLGCRTLFELDDERVPQEGVRVRCSRCNQAFYVQPPDSDPVTPDPNEHTREFLTSLADDPWSSTGSDHLAPPEPAPPESEESEEESDWGFNEDPSGAGEDDLPEPRSEPMPDLGPPAAADPSEPAPPDRQSLDDLGDPSSWNFFTEPEASRQPATGAPRPEASSSVLGSPDRHEGSSLVSLEPEPDAEERPAQSAGPDPRLSRAGWAVVAVLLALCVSGMFPSGPAPVAAQAPRFQVSGLEALDVRGTTLENAWVGDLFVVSGRLRNPNSSSRPLQPLQVVLLRPDGSGVPTQPVLVGSTVPEEVLREAAPEILAGRVAWGLHGASSRFLAPGESRDFAAVFLGLPEDADRFLLEAAQEVSRVPPVGEPEDVGAGVQDAELKSEPQTGPEVESSQTTPRQVPASSQE